MAFENNFKEEDKQKLIDFLNMVARHAKFEMNTNELIKYFHTLSYIQKIVLPKITDHLLEVKRVVEAKDTALESTEQDKGE